MKEVLGLLPFGATTAAIASTGIWMIQSAINKVAEVISEKKALREEAKAMEVNQQRTLSCLKVLQGVAH